MVTRIKPPKYRVGRYILNEYELRQLMLEVCRGEKPFGQTVKDKKGKIAIIQRNGTLNTSLFGLDLNSSATLEMIKLRTTQS